MHTYLISYLCSKHSIIKQSLIIRLVIKLCDRVIQDNFFFFFVGIQYLLGILFYQDCVLFLKEGLILPLSFNLIYGNMFLRN